MLSPKLVRFVITLSFSLAAYKILHNQMQISKKQQTSRFRSNLNKNSVAYVTIADVFIEPKRAPQEIQKIKIFLKKYGAKYTKIILNLTHCRLQGNKISAVNIFLQTLFIENTDRTISGLERIQLYFHVPSKLFMNSMENSQCLDVTCFNAFLYNYMSYSRIVSGIVFDSSLITSSFSKEWGTSEIKASEIWKRILTMAKFARQLKAGKELKIGILIQSYKDCENLLGDLPNYIVSQLDIALYGEKVYKWAGSFGIDSDSGHGEKGFETCNKIFLLHFQELPLYHVKEFYF